MNIMLQCALDYITFGWKICPLSPGRAWLSHATQDRLGSTAPTADRDEVRRWFEIIPELNIGVDTRASGLTVLSVYNMPLFLDWANRHGGEPRMGPVLEHGAAREYFFAAGDFETIDIASQDDLNIRLWTDAIVSLPPSQIGENKSKWHIPPLWFPLLTPPPDWIFNTTP